MKKVSLKPSKTFYVFATTLQKRKVLREFEGFFQKISQIGPISPWRTSRIADKKSYTPSEKSLAKVFGKFIVIDEDETFDIFALLALSFEEQEIVLCSFVVWRSVWFNERIGIADHFRKSFSKNF